MGLAAAAFHLALPPHDENGGFFCCPTAAFLLARPVGRIVRWCEAVFAAYRILTNDETNRLLLVDAIDAGRL
jgi:hypothetical protein